MNPYKSGKPTRTNNHLFRNVLNSAVFELNEAIKRLKRLDSSLTENSLAAGRAGTDAGYAIFVILNRYTDLLADCQKQCLAINKFLQNLLTQNSSALARMFNWQILKEPLDLQTSIRMLARMGIQLQDNIDVYANSMVSMLDSREDALPVIMFGNDMRDLRDACESLEDARKLLIEAELLQIHTSNILSEQAWDFISAEDLRILLARDYQELGQLLDLGARKSALVICGSIIEAAMVSVLRDIEPTAMATYTSQFSKSAKPIEHWKLWELIAVAESCNLVDQDTRRQADILRDYRNLIHPMVETRRGTELDDELVHAQVALLKRILRMLSNQSQNVSLTKNK